MYNCLIQPCELMVWYILPAIRSELAKDLLELDLTQVEVAKKMNITQPSVSQYLNNKRGYTVDFNSDIKELIFNLAKDICDDKVNGNGISSRICDVCKVIQEENLLDEIVNLCDLK